MYVYRRRCEIAMADAPEEFDLSKYIAAEKLTAMSDLEQRCCANRIKNYEMMKSIGNTPYYVVKINFVNIFLCSVLYEWRNFEACMMHLLNVDDSHP